MSGVPPRLIRRAITVPAMLLLSFLALLLLPITLTLAALHDVLHPRSRGRALRAVLTVTAFGLLECWAVLTLGLLWLRAGGGRRLGEPEHQHRQYQVFLQYLHACYRLTQYLLHVRVELEGADEASLEGRPLLVFCRHAGPGDSLLIVHALMHRFGREPRIVMKDTLQWAPTFDIGLNRIPSAFLSSGPSAPGAPLSRAEQGIHDLASGLDHNDAIVIFPEGGNFTVTRRTRAIDRLHREGRRRHAALAQEMEHVLPPRPGGVLAALSAAPNADVVWVAHTGTDHLHTPGDIWQAIPLRDPLLMHWWQVPAGEIPRTRDEQIAWLYDWWEQIDTWIAANRGAPGG